MKKRHKIILSIVAGLLVVLAAAWALVRAQIYQPSVRTTAAAQQATKQDGGLVFPAQQVRGPAVVFYPGALVEPASYSLWASRVAAAGYPVYIARFPLDLAVLAGQRADKYLQANRQPDYVIGGHSLGGVMASRYAAQHPSAQLHGVYFLASYPDQKGDLHDSKLPVLSLTGSRDGVLQRAKWQAAKKWLPTTTEYRELTGGNHAGFGSYGRQKGDRTATVSNAAQQRWVAAQMIAWLASL